MQSDEIRSKFLKFFENRGHKIIPSSSLIPENDNSVLFTTAGMQQFKPYYTNPQNADEDFGSRNIVTVQKCIRTGDIDEVGDATHLTFFEMLGNFSFGGYGRKEAITYAHDFITKELGLEISYVTFYKGEGVVPRDEESRDIWAELGVKDIREDGSDVFWGPTGDSGPCGPTTEIYCKNANGDDVEIWNIVFNEYFCDGSREKLDKGEVTLKKLDVLGVDTGMGFERLVSIVQKKKSVYETDLFNNEENKKERIVADHIKAALFLVSNGVFPSNTGAGYVVRRLIRRAVRFSKKSIEQEIEKIRKIYKDVYILDDKGEIGKEENKFRKTLEYGLKEFEKGVDPFVLFTTYGFPIELTEELAKEKGEKINREDFNKKMAEHQKLSQTASAGMFKGGLASMGEMETKYHTATHLLLAALRKVLGEDITQKGSNITSERMRFDFNWPEKVGADKLKEVEYLVNAKIKEAIPVEMHELPKEEALKIVKNLSFDLSKYGDIVKVYKIGDFSVEFCGGPHVLNTSELGEFKIRKEEASAAGIRRIKAVLL
ncbi:MAG: alanine--tRNA ligase [Candidatus Paceibacterota bacterium]